MNSTLSILDVAERFLSLSIPGSKKSITPVKLQNLVFYSQAIHLAVRQQPLFEEDFEAWVHRPMSPTLYYTYKKYRLNDIERPQVTPSLHPNDDAIIQLTWSMYGDKDGHYLTNKVHKELPYRLTRGNIDFYENCHKVIPKELIQLYYSRKFLVTEL